MVTRKNWSKNKGKKNFAEYLSKKKNVASKKEKCFLYYKKYSASNFFLLL